MDKGAIIKLVNSGIPSGIAAVLGFVYLMIVIVLTLMISIISAISWLKQVSPSDLQARHYHVLTLLGVVGPLLLMIPMITMEGKLIQSLTYNKPSTFYYQQSYPVVKVSQTLLNDTVKGNYVVYIDHGKRKRVFVASYDQLVTNRIGNRKTAYQVTIEELKPGWRQYANQVPKLKFYELSGPKLTIIKYQTIKYREVGS